MVALSAEVYPATLGGGEQDAREAQAHWQAGHKALAARSTRGRWSVVPGATHFIHTSRPEAVVAAIRTVVAEARHSGRSRAP